MVALIPQPLEVQELVAMFAGLRSVFDLVLIMQQTIPPGSMTLHNAEAQAGS